MSSFSRALAVAGALTFATASTGFAQDDALYAKAKEDGSVTIYSATDSKQVQTLIEAFNKKYPGITVDYNDVGTTGTYNKVVSEFAAGQVSADLIWSSAMDLQMTMATDGLFESADFPERSAIPEWAAYKDVLYATSIEPIGILYNKIELAEDKVPKTRADLIAFMKSDAAKGRVGSLDPERSGTGFLFNMNDSKTTTDSFWELVTAFGAAGGKTYASNGPVRESVGSGENVLAFNIIGSYAFDWSKESPSLGVAFDRERTAAFMRPIGLMKNAPHPSAGLLFMNFLFSKEGQTELAKNGLPSVRSDLNAADFDAGSLVGYDMESLKQRIGGEVVPIALNESLVAERTTERAGFIDKWRQSVR
jgi:iron(III) transport system substrate-binding protein